MYVEDASRCILMNRRPSAGPRHKKLGRTGEDPEEEMREG